MKINFNKWTNTYHSPHLTVINNKGVHYNDKGYIQISFVVLSYHWWITINKK